MHSLGVDQDGVWESGQEPPSWISCAMVISWGCDCSCTRFCLCSRAYALTQYVGVALGYKQENKKKDDYCPTSWTKLRGRLGARGLAGRRGQGETDGMECVLCPSCRLAVGLEVAALAAPSRAPSF